LGKTNSDLTQYFVDKSLPLDALAVLELQLAQNPQDRELTSQYWETINDNHRQSWEKEVSSHSPGLG
jgi:hypothetical protein